LDTQGLGLITPGNYTPVIVAQDNDRFTVERGIKDPFAAGVKVIAVYQGKHG
jgi:hypothetical protein